MRYQKNESSNNYYGVRLREGGTNIRYRALIRLNNVVKSIGTFGNELDAAYAYDNYVRKNHLNRRLNFPDPEPENLIPNTRLIRLSRGEFAIVDEEDFERVNQFHWTATGKGNKFYATRHILVNGKRKGIKMHRFILGETEMDIDHINGNSLHNYKSNLRECTNAQNSHNSLPCINSYSKYKGVFKPNKYNKFRSAITHNGKSYHLGFFYDEIEAAKAYDLKAKELFGEFARLNFP